MPPKFKIVLWSDKFIEEDQFLQNPSTSSLKQKKGKVFVAKYFPNKEPYRMDDAKTVLLHTKEGLSPYILKNKYGHILENIWQFSKVYCKVTKQKISKHKFRPNDIVWSHPEEIHIDKNGNLTQNYWNWREKGMNNSYAIRYPNGFYGRHKCVYSAYTTNENPCKPGTIKKLNYIESRKKIYCDLYIKLASTHKELKKLQSLHYSGIDLIITEVDGPSPFTSNKKKWPLTLVTKESPALEINEERIKILINDPSYPFGHGYVIASLILNGHHWMQ